MGKLDGLVAIVTGGGSGIGLGIVEGLAREGADVAVVGRRRKPLQHAQASIAALGRRSLAMEADLLDVRQIEEIPTRVADVLGGVDILVNCAGIFRQESIGNSDPKFFDVVLNTNLRAPYLLTRACVPYFRSRSRGKVVNIGSIAGEVGFPLSSVYCASKAGLAGLTRAMALELAPEAINVNCVSPHNVVTSMNKQLLEDNPTYREAQLDRSPLGRLGKVEDVVPAVLYLASRDSDYVNGITIFVDGGWLTQ